MNERIRELWDTAARLESDPSWEGQTKFMEKFAELIVAECIEVARLTDPSDSDEYRSGRYWAGLDIKKHFGVEE